MRTGSEEAHPHSRGENSAYQGMPGERSGSSPLTRGKRDRLWRGVCGVRLIPTHAGKTTPDDPPLHLPPAHPHSRGENNGFEVTTIPVKGSSPLTRGKPGLHAGARRVPRLIPTHAGKTRCIGGQRTRRRAHPHSRGENATVWSASSGYMGSSPLTRGKLVGPSTVRRPGGLIPTHAGKTQVDNHQPTHYWAHPHSRGENVTRHAARHSHGGSSPLTRGKLIWVRSRMNVGGLIPTHAGKTSL